MKKVKCHPSYPPEKGRYLRGNDFSPAAVVIILNHDEDKIPPEIEELVRTGAESGAALSGTLQTPNIGLEKMICNIVANPNIRHLILSGPESEGHLTGDALKALVKNGTDDNKTIMGTDALHPVLYNLPDEYIERFRNQINLIDLQFQGSPSTIRKAVWSCFQEKAVTFEGYALSDPGAYPEPPLEGKLTSWVTESWKRPQDASERKAVEKMHQFVNKLRNKHTGKKP